MRPDQNDPGQQSSFHDDPLLQALADLDPAASEPAPVVGSDRHLTILEHAMSDPTGSTGPSRAPSSPLPYGADPDATDLDARATYPTTPDPTRRRGPGRLAVGIAAILATFAGGFAFNTLTQPDGASTPEDAVQALFDAIDDEDLIGVVEALEPNERRIVRPTLERLSEELERIELVSGDLDLRDVEGVDLMVGDLDLRASYLGDGVATVTIVDGSIRGSGDLADLPMGRVLEDVIERQRGTTVWLEADDPVDLSGIQLVARKVDGSWHVSILYTLAELLRHDMDPQPDPPAYGRGVAPTGADSPEAAVRELVEAAVAVDARRMTELMPPGEGDVFHDYGPILIERLADADPTDIVVEALDLEVQERSGSRAEVGATRMRIVSDGDGDPFSIDYDGECTVTTFTYRFSSYVNDELESESSETQTHDTCEDEAVGATLVPFLVDVHGVSINTVEHDGRWYVSPTTTIFDWLLDSLAAHDADQLERDLRAVDRPWLAYTDEFWEACGITRPAEDTDPETGNAALDDCWTALPEDFTGAFTTGDGGLGLFGLFGFWSLSSSESFSYEGEAIEGGEWPGDECYRLETPDPGSRDQVASCLDGLVAEGTLDPWDAQSYRCMAVYDELWGGRGDREPADEEVDAADRAWEACMDESETTNVDPVPPGSSGPDSGGSATPTTVAGEAVPEDPTPGN